MQYDRSTTREKWTMMMYMRDFDLMANYAYALRMSNDLSSDNIEEILGNMEKEGIYRPRSGGSTFTGQFKYIQIAWYLFGYYNNSKKHGKKKKMVFSPLGNLLLDHIRDKKKTTKIFMAMLFAIGLRHPFSQMDNRFNIYAFRLVFQLLRDPRLEGKLYNDEMFYLVMFLKTVTKEGYEELVQDILQLRAENPYTKQKRFEEDECVVGLALHEWRYVTGMLETAGIVEKCNDNGERLIGKLGYGKKDANGKYSVYRRYLEDYVVLEKNLIPFLDVLLKNYPYDDRPYPDEKSDVLSNSAAIRMYFFYPPELLEELGMDTKDDKAVAAMLQITNEIYDYAAAGIENTENFRYVLNEAFRMFSDVESERIHGTGNADITCAFKQGDRVAQKFNIEIRMPVKQEKGRQRINSHTLKTHRQKTGADYALVVACDYTKSALKDIEGRQAVIIQPVVLANYLNQSILKNGREISYAALNEIIIENLGKDITELVENYIYNHFGHGAQDFKRVEAQK